MAHLLQQIYIMNEKEMEGKSVGLITFKKVYEQIAMNATYLDINFFLKAVENF